MYFDFEKHVTDELLDMLVEKIYPIQEIVNGKEDIEITVKDLDECEVLAAREGFIEGVGWLIKKIKNISELLNNYDTKCEKCGYTCKKNDTVMCSTYEHGEPAEYYGCKKCFGVMQPIKSSKEIIEEELNKIDEYIIKEDTEDGEQL